MLTDSQRSMIKKVLLLSGFTVEEVTKEVDKLDMMTEEERTQYLDKGLK